MTYLKPRSATRAKPDRRSSFEGEVLVHLDSLYGVALRMTRDNAAAEDLVHDTVLKAIRAWDQYQPGTNLKAWLLRILTNTFINRYRRGGLERDLFEGPDADPLSDRWIGAATMRGMREPEREALAPLVEAEVQKALDSLPEHFRMAIVLSDVEGLSYREIADVMGCPIGTVMSRLHRGRAILQQLLRAHAVALGIIEDDDELAPLAAERNETRAAAVGGGEALNVVELKSRKRGSN
jgi:RNA polymerase sigma-70 factor (ECF subfamily)